MTTPDQDSVPIPYPTPVEAYMAFETAVNSRKDISRATLETITKFVEDARDTYSNIPQPGSPDNWTGFLAHAVQVVELSPNPLAIVHELGAWQADDSKND
jgi:hypothetical protein